MRADNADRDAPGVEPRPRHPLRGKRRVRGLAIVVTHIDGHEHLPVVALREAA